MPLYEYKCLNCEKVHEVMQKFSDGPLAECPDCRGSVTKLMSLGSFALKGTGWYTTDYKRKSSTSQTSQSNKPSSAPAASEATSAPSAPSVPSAPVSSPGSGSSTPSSTT